MDSFTVEAALCSQHKTAFPVVTETERGIVPLLKQECARINFVVVSFVLTLQRYFPSLCNTTQHDYAKNRYISSILCYSK